MYLSVFALCAFDSMPLAFDICDIRFRGKRKFFRSSSYVQALVSLVRPFCQGLNVT